LAFVGCWGYNGVFWYAMVRAYPDAPGRITGALSPGGLAGSTLGPVVFGWLVDQLGYQTAWRWFVGLALFAGAVLSWAGRQLERAPGPPAGS
jgi:MFS family permease